MANPQTKLAPEDRMSALLAAIRKNVKRGMRDLDDMLGTFPDDPRLHFLKGSLLAGREDYAAARTEMRRAVDLAPDFAVARFQLGLLLLTSGEPHAAQETWGPLHGLPPDNYLHLFVRGLTHLIHDQFEDTVRLLQKGISRNHENAPMNNDMQMIVDEVQKKMTGKDKGASATSSVDLLLQQARLKSRH